MFIHLIGSHDDCGAAVMEAKVRLFLRRVGKSDLSARKEPFLVSGPKPRPLNAGSGGGFFWN